MWASYDAKGANKREFCRRHAGHDMVDLVSKMCVHPECAKQATFGVWGSRTREFCAGHATEETVCVGFTSQGAQKKSAQKKPAPRVTPKTPHSTPAVPAALKQRSESRLPMASPTRVQAP